MTLNKRGFTLIELLVVIGMIMTILGALTTSVTKSQQRARIQKAASEVKVISQAILAYENMSKDNKLEPVGGEGPAAGEELTSSTVGYLLGNGGQSQYGGDKIPVLLMAQLSAGGSMRDPWGTPYKLVIREGNIQSLNSISTLTTGYYLPNFYRLSEEERK